MSEVEGLPKYDRREKLKRKRERWLIFFLAILFGVLLYFEIRLTKSSMILPLANSIFFFGLLNFNIIILLILFWLIIRNVGKLFLERRRQVLGSRLKTKLVMSFIGFAIVPTVILFIISSLYIHSSFDKWFSLKIQNTLQASLDITRTYYKNADQSAFHFAEHLAQQLKNKKSLEEIQNFLKTQRDLLSLDAVEYYPSPLDPRWLDQKRKTQEEGKRIYPRLALDLLDRVQAGEKMSVLHHLGSGDLIRVLLPVPPHGGVLVVNTYLPVSLVNRVDEIASVFDDYQDTNPLKYPIKTTYFVILVLITLLILFVAIWMGIYLARELTVPVERLVEGAQMVGSGNLDVVIKGSGHDEISVLIRSFNRMTQDLKKVSSDLEKRKQELEVILKNVNTGVIAFSPEGEITEINQVAAKLLNLQVEEVTGKRYSTVFRGEAEPLREGIEECKKSSIPVTKQWLYRKEDQIKTYQAHLNPITTPEGQSMVMVMDDLTPMMKDQREMAWREVARRIAHEIKNPLTPIKLSAQRLQRRMGQYAGKDGLLLKECTDTIIMNTDELKVMVDEFSNFARLPEVQPTLGNLHECLEESLSLFRASHPKIQFEFDQDEDLPDFDFDFEQMKRVFVNLLTNSVSAINSQGQSGKIWIRTLYNRELSIVAIEIEDNGPGIAEDLKDRIFEPYFSTKKEGTGLGLSIVKRIINDHNGFIRIKSQIKNGVAFVIELPVIMLQNGKNS